MPYSVFYGCSCARMSYTHKYRRRSSYKTVLYHYHPRLNFISNSVKWTASSAAVARVVAILKTGRPLVTYRDYGGVQALFGEPFSRTGSKTVAEWQREEGSIALPRRAVVGSVIAKPPLGMIFQRTRKVFFHPRHGGHIGKYERLQHAWQRQA